MIDSRYQIVSSHIKKIVKTVTKNCIFPFQINWHKHKFDRSYFGGRTFSAFEAHFVFFLFYNTALITFAMVFTVIGKTPKKTVTYMTIVICINRLLFLMLERQTTEMPLPLKIIGHLFYINVLTSNSRFLDYMEKFDMSKDFDSFKFGFNIPYDLIMLSVNILTHTFLIWYIQEILPGKYMEPKKWWFIFDFRPKRKDERDLAGKAILRQWIEYATPPVRDVLFCNRLCKLDNVSGTARLLNCTFKAYLDEVTILSGHMEGGLSVAINIINGLIQPSSGVLKIFGKEVPWNHSGYINTCPPDNAFFYKLTAAENIKFMCKLKGLSKSHISREIKLWRHYCSFSLSKQIDRLSYDEQRILSLACTLCGSNKIITMYEPTINMTPKYKKIFWNIIGKERPGRAFIVATSSLDEAFRIGNRVGIMENGLVKCYGTPFFLRTKIAGGYRLVSFSFHVIHFSKNCYFQSILKSSKTDSGQVLTLMKPFMGNIKVERETPNSLTFCIPSYHMNHFAEMWDKVWSQKNELGLKQYDIVSQRLEEVFMLLDTENLKNAEICKKIPVEYFRGVKTLTGFKLFKSRMTSVALKKIYNPPFSITAVLLMVITYILVVYVSKYAKKSISSEAWMSLGKADKGEPQMLRKAQVRYFIDRGGGGEFYEQFSGFRMNFERQLSKHFDTLCLNCIGIERPPDKFFAEMPYFVPDLVPRKYLIDKEKAKCRSSMSFTYALENFEHDGKVAQGLIKTNKKLTVYFNMQELHSSFTSLNFAHNLVLL